MTNKELALEALIVPTVRALGCEVWGVEYRARARGSALKVFIDAPDGATVDDCERVSNQVSALLDVEDPIVEAYRLEVSSPGLDRTLFRREQYLANVGERVDVRLAFPFEGRRRFEGELAGVEGDDVVVRIDSDEFLLPFGQIQRTRIVPDYAQAGLRPSKNPQRSDGQRMQPGCEAQPRSRKLAPKRAAEARSASRQAG